MVTELKRERRNALILSLAGVGILLILLLLYMTAIGEDDVPTVKKGTATEQGAQPTQPIEPAEPAEPEQPSPEPVTNVAKATVKLVLTKKAQVWVDGKSLGKIKNVDVELTADEEHEIRAKLGKKMVTKTLSPKAGETWDLRFDVRRKKAKLKKSK